MSKHRNVFSVCWAALARQALRLGADRRGNVAMIMGLSMVPIVGALGTRVRGLELVYEKTCDAERRGRGDDRRGHQCQLEL